jgi:2-oxoglutarate ferredoxin oxidoreductase subunit gamma
MDKIEIRFGGTGGQGLQLCARLLADALSNQGFNVARSQSYEPTSRGGISRSDLVVSKDAIDFPLLSGLDVLLLLDQPALAISLPLLKQGAMVIADSRRTLDISETQFEVYKLPLSEVALSMGNERVTNIIALGAFAGLSDLCDHDILQQAITDGVPPRFIELNLSAYTKGYEMTSNSRIKLVAG